MEGFICIIKKRKLFISSDGDEKTRKKFNFSEWMIAKLHKMEAQINIQIHSNSISMFEDTRDTFSQGLWHFIPMEAEAEPLLCVVLIINVVFGWNKSFIHRRSKNGNFLASWGNPLWPSIRCCFAYIDASEFNSARSRSWEKVQSRPAHYKAIEYCL